MSVTSVINEEKVKNLLDSTLKAIQSDADPQLLNQYRALIRKNVSFFRRSYLAAYLLMLQDQPQGRRRRSGGGDTLRGRPHPRDNAAINGAEPGEGAESVRQGPRTPAPVALPEDESTRLFINIGRNRRIFPREILGLIGAKTSVAKEDIGTITILNNYSFVQVRSSVAADLVETLNGVSFRGRTLAVNYARARKEEDEGPLPAAKPSVKQGSEAIDDGAYTAYDDAYSDGEPGDASEDANVFIEPSVSGDEPVSGEADALWETEGSEETVVSSEADAFGETEGSEETAVSSEAGAFGEPEGSEKTVVSNEAGAFGETSAPSEAEDSGKAATD